MNEDPGFVEWVRTQECCVGQDCKGKIVAVRAGAPRGLGTPAHDRTAVPLCRAHAKAFTERSGFFARLLSEQRRMWASELSIALQNRFAEDLERKATRRSTIAERVEEDR